MTQMLASQRFTFLPFVGLIGLVLASAVSAQPGSVAAPSLPALVGTPVSASDTGVARAAGHVAQRNPSRCVGSEVDPYSDTDTPSFFTFGPNDHVTGVPGPTLDATGWYESIDGVAPGKEVCQVQVGIGNCANPSGTLSVRVTIYAPDAADPTLPDLTTPLGGSAPFDPVAAGCPAAGFFGFVEVPMSVPVDLEDRDTFVVGLETVAVGTGDSVALISSGNGEGNAAGRNSTATINFGLIDYRDFIGIDFNLAFHFASRVSQLTGADGWRMMAAPSTSATVGGGGIGTGFLDFIWTQGYLGADFAANAPETANVFRYDETVTGLLEDGYVPPASADEPLDPGTGLYVYVYGDNDFLTPGIQGGFPKTLGAVGPEPTLPFVFSPTFTSSGTATDDGWMLLGNPFYNGLNWDAAGWTKTAMSNAIYVYDPVLDLPQTWNGTTGDLLSGTIGPFQAFWAQAMAAGPALVAPAGSVSSGGTFIGRPAAVPQAEVPQVELVVETVVSGETRSDRAYVTFQEGATDGRDRFDAFELKGMGTLPIRLFAVVEDADGPLALNIAAQPAHGGTVRLGVARVEEGLAVLRWPEVTIPDGWQAMLLDTVTGTEIDLLNETEYSFVTTSSEEAGYAGANAGLPPGSPAAGLIRPSAGAGLSGAGRFLLRLGATSVATEGDAATAAEVSGVYPNPTTGTATVRVTVPAPEHVRVVVYDAVGRVVLTALDATVAGRAEVDLDTSQLAAGTYVVRVEGTSFVEMRQVVVAR